ncbi:MAG TPA: amino acid permease [Polyangiaceae bacterium]|nr:amino acid permease [Polyangiaceae bacterium]
MPSSAPPPNEAPSSALGAQKLGLWDAVSIIVGIVIGAGIYETPPLVFSAVSEPAEVFAVWALGGLLSLIGACCYAELASTYPRSGGDYVYLTRAFSPLVGFLFGWAQLSVIMTGSIGMMAYVFADYGSELWGLNPSSGALLAASAVLILTACNLAGVALGKAAQNALSLLKLLGLVAVVACGFLFAGAGASPAVPSPSQAGSSLGMAMILVLYTFGGWNDAAYVAAEVSHPRRNLPRALLLGTLLITLVYLLINAAFLVGLGFEGARTSRAIAVDLLRGAFGPGGATVISVLVMVSALSAVNALIFTGSRLHATLGRDYDVLGLLGRWHPRLGAPVWSLLVQLVITLVLIATVGTRAGRGAVDGGLSALGFARADWSGHGGFDALLRCTAPVFWLFFLLTGLSLFVLRVREPARARPFRVPLYPLLPAIFCATCAAMLYSAISYAGKLTLIGFAPLLLGIPLYFASKGPRRRTSDEPLDARYDRRPARRRLLAE